MNKHSLYSRILYRADLPSITERELTLADKKREQEKKETRIGRITEFHLHFGHSGAPKNTDYDKRYRADCFGGYPGKNRR